MNIFGTLDPSVNFSILIPSYNDSLGLISTLDSLKEEIYTNILIIDDGSAQHVSELLSNYYSPHNIIIIRLEQNSGIIIGLNTGIEFLYKNDIRYVYRLDACDLHIVGRLNAQMEAIIATDSAIVGGHVEYFNDSDSDSFILKLPIDYPDIKKLQFIRSCFIHPAVLMDLKKIYSTSAYRERYVHAEDYDLFLRTVISFKCVNIDRVVVKCLIRKDGISLSNRQAQIKSVFRTQLDNFQFHNIYSYLGLLKTSILLIAPLRFVNLFKKIFLFK